MKNIAGKCLSTPAVDTLLIFGLYNVAFSIIVFIDNTTLSIDMLMDKNDNVTFLPIHATVPIILLP